MLLAFIIVSSLAHGQKIDSDTVPLINKNHFLSKGKVQKAIGWTIFGTGVPVVLFTGYFLVNFNKSEIDKPLLTTVFIASVAYTLVSIPLIKAGSRNKRKALTITLTKNKILIPQVCKAGFKNQPAISLTLNL